MFAKQIAMALAASGLSSSVFAACDGPYYEGGATINFCQCSTTVRTTKCTGPITVLQSHYTCGGTTAEHCDDTGGTFGTTSDCMWTITLQQQLALVQAYARWLACTGPGCVQSTICGYGSCVPTAPTTPISGPIYAGSSGTCTLARVGHDTSPSVLVALGRTPSL